MRSGFGSLLLLVVVGGARNGSGRSVNGNAICGMKSDEVRRSESRGRLRFGAGRSGGTF